MSGGDHNQADTRQALLPMHIDGRRWVTVCNGCECVVVNWEAHAKVCPARGVVSS